MNAPVRPPKPPARTGEVSLRRYAQLFRKDILSAQPERLYRAWMAEFRTPMFRSFLINQPDLVSDVLKARPADFPKSPRAAEGLRPLLGNGVFLSTGATWARQRRIIDPAFEGGRLRETFPAMWAAADAAAYRLEPAIGQQIDLEPQCSHVAADVIFRTLFSIPIEDQLAAQVYTAFQNYQRSQPLMNLAALIPLPRWMPRYFRPQTRKSAAHIRGLIRQLTAARADEIARDTAPDDLATKIMTRPDPETGKRFTNEEMVDQVAIFFLAGHETSASALAWSLYLLALYPEWQERVAEEARGLTARDLSDMSRLRTTRDVFREALRLYPPVPMMVRQAECPVTFRSRSVPKGSQIIVSPWHLHRHTRLWEAPDAFDPSRWQTENGQTCARTAYIPFSAGARVCPGAGFAMVEGPLLLARLLRDVAVEPIPDKVPVPVAHLTVRSRSGIHVKLVRR